MQSLLKVLGGLALVGILVGGGYAAGAAFQPPEVRIVTQAKEVEVPGPVQWKTRRVPFVRQSCYRAIEAGNDMADMLDDYDSLAVDAYNAIDDAYNAGVRYDDFRSLDATYDQLDSRFDELRETWDETPWFGPASGCESRH
jgi:hypothetical protein